MMTSAITPAHPVHRVRVLLSVLTMLALSCCQSLPPPGTPDPAPPQPAAQAASFAPEKLRALLLAGDGAVPAFDRAIDYLAELLEKAGVPHAAITSLSATTTRRSETRLASLIDLRQSLEALHPEPGGTCLIYLVAHGTPDRGIYLPVSDRTLTPEALDHALDLGCGTAPTIIVVSACYAGLYATPPMTRPNRIILTAAAVDRASFGCAPGTAYTSFDECFLGAVTGAPDWMTVIDRTLFCVDHRERLRNLVPSSPQTFLGRDVIQVPAPLAALRANTLDGIRFTPGPVPFNAKLVLATLGASASSTILGPSTPRTTQINRELARYQEARAPKALVATPDGYITRAGGDPMGTGVPVPGSRMTPDDAARLALQRCEYLTGGACILLARNQQMNAPLVGGEPPFHPQILRRSGGVRAEDTPFILIDDQPKIAIYLAMPGPKALALRLNRPGLAIATGPDPAAARTAALAQCREDGGSCVIYAENNEIVLGATP